MKCPHCGEQYEEFHMCLDTQESEYRADSFEDDGDAYVGDDFEE